MSANSLRTALTAVLWLQLSLLIVRQIIDFCGVQWLNILVNFVAILVTIAALFGHFLVHFWFQLFAIFHNFVVICVYNQLFPQNAISLDANQRSFVHQVLQSHAHFTDSQSELWVRRFECIQASLHALLSALAVCLHALHFRRIRRQNKRLSAKTTPPLPPYTISPLHNAFLTTNHFSAQQSLNGARQSTKRRSQKRRALQAQQRQQQRPKLITSAVYYSDSETDFYGATNAAFSAFPNPVYARAHNETRI